MTAADRDRLLKRLRRRPLYTPGESAREMTLGRDAITRLIPHREPMLLVDRITLVDFDEQASRSHRRIDPADPLLRGHFPGYPVYPGALLVEMMGQASLCLHKILTLGRTDIRDGDRPRPLRLLRLHGALFQDEALPGDDLVLLSRRLESDDFTVICAGQVLKPDGRTICASAIMEVYLLDEEG